MGDDVTVKIRLKSDQAAALKALARQMEVHERDIVGAGHAMLTRALGYYVEDVPDSAEPGCFREALRTLASIFSIDSESAHHGAFLAMATACEAALPAYRRILTGPAGGTDERPPALQAQEEAIQRYTAQALDLAIMTIAHTLGPGAAREIHKTVAEHGGHIQPTPATLGLIDAAHSRIVAHLRDSFRPDREAH